MGFTWARETVNGDKRMRTPSVATWALRASLLHGVERGPSDSGSPCLPGPWGAEAGSSFLSCSGSNELRGEGGPLAPPGAPRAALRGRGGEGGVAREKEESTCQAPLGWPHKKEAVLFLPLDQHWTFIPSIATVYTGLLVFNKHNGEPNQIRGRSTTTN